MHVLLNIKLWESFRVTNKFNNMKCMLLSETMAQFRMLHFVMMFLCMDGLNVDVCIVLSCLLRKSSVCLSLFFVIAIDN